MILCGLTNFHVGCNGWFINYREGDDVTYPGSRAGPVKYTWTTETHPYKNKHHAPGTGSAFPLTASCAAICWDDAELFQTHPPHGFEIMEGDVALPEHPKGQVFKLVLNDGSVITTRFRIHQSSGDVV